ncbi:hypothetical protein BGM25_02405 [Bacillus sp. FJAT-29953]|nr:hypothetical protein [Bacillus sp. FJAT-29953]
MKKIRNMWYVPMIAVLLILGACSAQQELKGNAEDLHQQSLNEKGNGHVHGQNNVDVIPSVDRSKKHTTSTNNQTAGLGENVYSLIGSSSLHDGGISSHLESRLAGQGITGIKVFVLDDTVILARAEPATTSTTYDEMQNKVLKNTTGLSGKGTLDGVDVNKLNTDDNLAKAKDLMNKAFNGQVQVLSITNPNALPLIDGIKANIKAPSPSYSKLSSDIITLVKMANEK